MMTGMVTGLRDDSSGKMEVLLKVQCCSTLGLLSGCQQSGNHIMRASAAHPVLTENLMHALCMPALKGC